MARKAAAGWRARTLATIAAVSAASPTTLKPGLVRGVPACPRLVQRVTWCRSSQCLSDSNSQYNRQHLRTVRGTK